MGSSRHCVVPVRPTGRCARRAATSPNVAGDEIGPDPSAELQGLEQRVLHQDPTLVAPGGPKVGLPPLPPELDPAGRLFVGRSDELAWLRRVWSEVAARGDARLLAIAGPTGSGRTRLLGEFAAELHAQGIAVHYGGLGVGLALLDDLDDRTVAFLHAVGGAGPMLCVAAYDPSRASPPVRRALIETAAEERLLPPLSRDEVAQIVVNIGGTVDADLVEEIAAAAEGWPSAVERLTMEVIGQRSVQRVAAAADRAGPASRTLTAARGEVAAGVRGLTRVRSWQAEAQPDTDRLACPYKGLAAYEQGDAPLFHGPGGSGRSAVRAPSRHGIRGGGRPLGRGQVVAGAGRCVTGARRRRVALTRGDPTVDTRTRQPAAGRRRGGGGHGGSVRGGLHRTRRRPASRPVPR
jgi:hypothetical protein